jgi:hypothetical protein
VVVNTEKTHKTSENFLENSQSGLEGKIHGIVDKVSEYAYFLSSLLSLQRDFPLHSEAAVSGGSTEESSMRILL